jgi:hypothetical protein
MTISFARHQFPPAIIRHAVWLYVRFTLSYRDVEDLLAERGLDVSYETVRRWVLKFGPLFARELRRRRPRPTSQWHLDEMAVMIAGTQFWLWRAVDDEGEVLDLLVQRRRDKAAAVRLMRKLLKKQGFAPDMQVQIQKQPFRTYFAEFDRLVASADALLVVGYGWMDTHVNLAFEHFRDERRRPVVAIEYARDDVWNARTPVGSGGHAAIHRLLGRMKTPYGAMSLIPQTVAGLKETREFELSRDPRQPLAIWYGGFLEACRHPEKVVRRLLSPA